MAKQSFHPRMSGPQMDGRAVTQGVGAVQMASARAFGAVADIAHDLEQQRLQAEGADAEVRMRTGMTVGLANLRQQVAAGDPTTMRERWQQGVRTLRERLVADLPERHRDRVSRVADQLQATEEGQIIGLQATRTRDASAANLTRSVSDLVQLGASGEDVSGQIASVVEAAVAGGVINEQAAERLLTSARRTLTRNVASARVRANGRVGPGALDILPLPPMPPEDMAALREEATQDMVTAGVEAEAEEQTIRASRAGVVTETVTRALSGDAPSAEDVNALRFDMPPATYRATMAVATGRAATEDDAPEVGALIENMGHAEPDRFAETVHERVAQGLLTPATAARLLDEDRALRADVQLMRRREDVRTAITRALPSCGSDDECETMWGKEGVADIRGAALDEWTAWARANPTASLAEQAEMRAIVAQQARDRAVTRLTSRLSTLPGRERPMAGQMYGARDLDAFEDETLKALEDGEISESEAAYRLTLAGWWRAALPPGDDETDFELMQDNASGARSGARR